MSVIANDLESSAPHWNRQMPSSMPVERYARNPHAQGVSKLWPAPEIIRAPLWSSVDLRDGNQSLPNPMDRKRKQDMFDLLVSLGFKDIEVGYPSASQTDFNFVRHLIENDLIPDDVTIGVFTPARTELIDRTFDAISGASNVVIHLCNATACLWRESVFGMTISQVRRMVDNAATHMVRCAARSRSTNFRFEYSPETFNVTEPEFALEISNHVASVCDASPDNPLILNLPSTVETDTPNVYANQIDYVHRNLDRRDAIILSVHPHNDRGTAVASAELALMSGADRVEGTLFGNGERTGNVCLITLALNLFSQGVDPQLDLSDIDLIRRTVEASNQMEVHKRHPYVGELVYTAFSGTHQDAISKGMAALQSTAAADGKSPKQVPWNVPYLPIDPMDVGRTYESIVRVNSQSGKGGVSHVLEHDHGIRLPIFLRKEFSRVVQDAAEKAGLELESKQLIELFRKEYIDRAEKLRYEFSNMKRNPEPRSGVDLTVELTDSRVGTVVIDESAPTVDQALIIGLNRLGYELRAGEVSCDTSHVFGQMQTIVFFQVWEGNESSAGVGVATTQDEATVQAVVAAFNRAQSIK